MNTTPLFHSRHNGIDRTVKIGHEIEVTTMSGVAYTLVALAYSSPDSVVTYIKSTVDSVSRARDLTAEAEPLKVVS